MHAALLILAAVATPTVEYRVSASAAAEQLTIDATVPAGVAARFTIDDPVRPYVEGLEQKPAKSCLQGCTLHYRFRLRDAARELHSRAWAFSEGAGVYAAPSSWLMRPEGASEARFTLQMTTPGELKFVSGLHVTPTGYEGPISALTDAPWSGFAAFRIERWKSGPVQVELAVAPGALGLSMPQIHAWVERSVQLVVSYHHGFPVRRVAIMMIPTADDDVGSATAMGNGGAAVLLWLGATASTRELANDWVLPHELFHFGLPNLPRANTWLEEGMATYVEPLIRARVGELTADDFWRQMVTRLPQGLPAAGDEGLDHTHTWGRTYWGGALFCLAADVELRERSKNAQSLDTALRGIVARGGTQEVQWSIERTLKAGDEATGLDVLTKLHARIASKPGKVDLDALFRRLGVAVQGRRVVYDDAAELAWVRKAMLSD